MRVNLGSPSAVATAVWGAATRTLTASPNTYTAVENRVSIAAGATLDLRPAAGVIRAVVLAIRDLDVRPGLYDGTNFEPQIAGGEVTVRTLFGNSTRGPGVINGDAAAQNIQVAGYDFLAV